MSIFNLSMVQSICLPKTSKAETPSSAQAKEAVTPIAAAQNDSVSLSPSSIALREMTLRYQNLELYEGLYKAGTLAAPLIGALTAATLIYLSGLTLITGAAGVILLASAVGGSYLLSRLSHLSGEERSIITDKMTSILRKLTPSEREPLIKNIEKALGKPIAVKISKVLNATKN